MKKSSKIVTLFALSTVSSFVVAEKQITVLKDNQTITDAGTKGDIKLLREGYIDAQSVMMNSKIGQAAQQELRTKQEDAYKRVEKNKEKIVKKQTDLANQANTLTAEAQNAKRKELTKDQQAHESFMQDLQEELQAEMIRITADLDQALIAAAEELARQENLDVVKDKTTGRALFTTAAADKSDKITKIIDDNYNKKLASNSKVKSAPAKPAA